MGKLEGKVALITGASRGIGRATAERLAGEGANLVLNYYSSADREHQKESAGDEMMSAVRKQSVDVIAYEADVSNREQVQAMVAKAEERFGRIDILVNNAGIGAEIVGDYEIGQMPERVWDRTLDVNLKGQFLVAQAVVPLMIRQRSGKIVNISSDLALMGGPLVAAYCASKAGVIGLTKSMARELAPHGILVNCIAPGPTDTDILRPGERTPEYLSGIPLQRLGKPSEIAAAICFLVGPDTTWTTGQVFSPNGGVVI
jgi:3-oxoacyl-[acyl-carrier protein] reductase